MNTPASGNQSTFLARLGAYRAAPVVVAVCTVAWLVAGCGPPAGSSQAPPARPTEATQTDFGDLEVHYNAIRTDQLTPEIARAYGIERSAQPRAAERGDAAPGRPTAAPRRSTAR